MLTSMRKPVIMLGMYEDNERVSNVSALQHLDLDWTGVLTHGMGRQCNFQVRTRKEMSVSTAFILEGRGGINFCISAVILANQHVARMSLSMSNLAGHEIGQTFVSAWFSLNGHEVCRGMSLHVPAWQELR